MSTTVTRTLDKSYLLRKLTTQLTSEEVLIGVFTQQAAQDLYVIERGSPLENIPAKSFMLKAIEEANEDNVAIMLEGARNAFNEFNGSPTSILMLVGDNTVTKVKAHALDRDINPALIDKFKYEVQ